MSQIETTTYHYLTLYESIKQNGDRHKANGDRYLSEGKLNYAAGSYRKAARNYERAMLCVGVQSTGHALIDLMIDKLVTNIEDDIMNGNGQGGLFK